MIRTNTNHRASLATATLVLLLSACGSASQTAPSDESSSASSNSSTAAPSYNASTASEAEKWTEYQRLVNLRGVNADTYGVPQGEVASVSAKLCDNSASDMATYVELLHTLYEEPSNFREDKLETTAFTKAYCPDATALLEAAYDAQEAAAAAEPPKPEDFVIAVKIKRKKCFGSAGCNVTYTIDPDYRGTADVSTGSYDITYEVTGDEDGPIINTFTLEDGTMTFDAQETAGTKTSKTKLKARVIDISET